MTKKLVAISVIICNALFYVGCASLDSDNPALRLKAISECPRGFDFDLEDIDEYKEISRKLERIASNEGEREDIRVAAFAKLVERSDTEACVRIILNNETNEQVVSSFVALSNRSIGLLLTMHADAGIGVIEKVRPTLVKTDVRPIDSECIARSLNRCLSSNDAISNERAKSLIAAIDAHGDWVSVYMSLVSLHDAADENVVKLCVEKLFSNHRDEAFDVVMSLASTDRDQNKSVEIAAEWLLQMELTPQEIDSAIGKLAKRDVSTSQENILRRFCEKCQNQAKMKDLASHCDVLYDYILDEEFIANYAMRASRDCTKIVNRIEDQDVLLKMSFEARSALTRCSAVKRLDAKTLIEYEDKTWVLKYQDKFRGRVWPAIFSWNESCMIKEDSIKEILRMQETGSDRRIAERKLLEIVCERIRRYQDKDAIDALIYLAELNIEGAKIAGVRLLSRYTDRETQVVKWAMEIANNTGSPYCGESRLRLARMLRKAEPVLAKEWYSKAVGIGYPSDEKLLSEINTNCGKAKYDEVICRNLWRGKHVGFQHGYGALKWGTQIDPEMKYYVGDDNKKHVDVEDNPVNFEFRNCSLIYDEDGFSGIEWNGSPFWGARNRITGAVDSRIRKMMREGFDDACEIAERKWGVTLTKTHMNNRLAAFGFNDSVAVTIVVPDDPDESSRYLVLKISRSPIDSD